VADLEDVSNALGVLIGAVLYPSGATSENPSPVAGLPVRVEVGWPLPQALQAAMAAGIYPRPAERTMTRYPRAWSTKSVNAPSYTLTQSGQVVTVGGAAPSPYAVQNLGVFVNGKAYALQATVGQTASQIAAALQGLILADVAGASVAGAAITLPSSARIGALRVGVVGTSQRELRRQERQFQITIWADTPAHRDAVSQPIDIALAATDWLTLADGSMGRLIYHGSPLSDFEQKQAIYRRDLIYAVEYATVQTATDTQIVVQTTNLQNDQGAVLASTTS
jgi:hypothetical protein